jgi:anti-sigma factor RsiW
MEVDMCPDPELLSVHADSELPSPWAEKMEAHLSECRICSSKLEQYRLLKRGNAAFGKRSGIDVDTLMLNAKNRVWANIQPMVAAASQVGAHRRASRSRMWTRRISVPVPIAAAAAAVFIAALGLVAVSNRNASTVVPVNILAAAPGSEGMLPLSDMQELVRYLNTGSDSDLHVIRLPEDTSFSASGKPILIRAADYYNSGGAALP